jgi:hypothetical protein
MLVRRMTRRFLGKTMMILTPTVLLGPKKRTRKVWDLAVVTPLLSSHYSCHYAYTVVVLRRRRYDSWLTLRKTMVKTEYNTGLVAVQERRPQRPSEVTCK